jgi:hypothetical protein
LESCQSPFCLMTIQDVGDPLIKSQFRRRPERNIKNPPNNSNTHLQGVRQWDMFVPLWFWHRTGTANRALPLPAAFADNNIAKSSSVYYGLGGH